MRGTVTFMTTGSALWAVPCGTDVCADAAADAGGRQTLGLACEMGVARRALDVGMAQQLADHAQALAGGEGAAGVAVAEVVDAHVVEACA